MVSPGLGVGREVARELLFADLGPAASAKALSRALSLAREALSALGEEVAGRLRADRAHIWFSAEAALEVDLVAHQEALRVALAMEPGDPRDAALSMVGRLRRLLRRHRQKRLKNVVPGVVAVCRRLRVEFSCV
jgi:hypothetical protein